MNHEVLITVTDTLAGGGPRDWSSYFLDKVAPPLVAGLCVALVGSLLLPRLNEQHKGRREHLSTNVQLILDELAAVQAEATNYWIALGRDGANEALIEFRLAKINSLLVAIGEDLWPGSAHTYADLFSGLASSIVTADFGDPDRPAEADRGRTIAAAAGAISSAVLVRRRLYFHQSESRRQLARWLLPAKRQVGRALRRMRLPQGEPPQGG